MTCSWHRRRNREKGPKTAYTVQWGSGLCTTQLWGRASGGPAEAAGVRWPTSPALQYGTAGACRGQEEEAGAQRESWGSGLQRPVNSQPRGLCWTQGKGTPREGCHWGKAMLQKADQIALWRLGRQRQQVWSWGDPLRGSESSTVGLTLGAELHIVVEKPPSSNSWWGRGEGFVRRWNHLLDGAQGSRAGPGGRHTPGT